MTAPAAPATAPKGRLGNGQLRRQVAEYLAVHPGPHKTGEVPRRWTAQPARSATR